MCVAEGTIHVVVKIDPKWFDFYLEPDGKYVTLWGKDLNTPYNGPFSNPEKPEYESQVLIPVAFEHHRSDFMYPEILLEAFDDDGNKYLIIKRNPIDK